MHERGSPTPNPDPDNIQNRGPAATLTQFWKRISLPYLALVSNLMSQHALAGLYIYGSVGSGKSLLMDMFFAEVEAADAVPLRRRLHFNAAMLEVRSPRACTSQPIMSHHRRLGLGWVKGRV